MVVKKKQNQTKPITPQTLAMHFHLHYNPVSSASFWFWNNIYVNHEFILEMEIQLMACESLQTE